MNVKDLNERVSAVDKETVTPEQKHARGYDDQPQTPEEVGEWEAEQIWDENELEQPLES